MSERDLIREILATYEKHGWTLRRVLLTGDKQKEAADFGFDRAIVETSAVNALWFSRPSQEKGREAWELRRISQLPYALFDSFSADVSDAERDARRRALERRLAQKL
jgi:hypothetical protein